ncbi:SAM dependent carboxyl methyltransferase [Rhizobiales bacterium GAS113]|nr:SAM dependent carboxyl methyltransferase [Rhizobiales bacterium GAS113]
MARENVVEMSDTAGFMAMKGAGYYSRATTGAREVINLAAPLILEAIARMGLADDGTRFRIADMGCADGGTSIEMWRKVLAQLRRALPSRPIEIVYTDLPRNDFSQLFRTIHNQTEIASYYGELDEVYPFASGTSFHQKIFPAQSLNLAFSATASHYISKVPCNITDHVHMVGAKGQERRAYDMVGRNEWDNLLALRARELVAGGRLVFLNFGIDEQGRYLGHTGGVSMFDTFSRLWKGLADEAVITADEYASTNFPQVYRTTEEFTAPLTDPQSAAYRAGLRLEHVESRHLVCPYARAFAQHRDAAKFARDYIPTLRSWSEPTFASGLSPARPARERLAILDTFFNRYEEAVATAPQGHGMDYVHIHLVCRKDPQ